MTKFETLSQLITDIQLLLADSAEWDKSFVKFEDKRQNYLKIDCLITEAVSLIKTLENDVEAVILNDLSCTQKCQLDDVYSHLPNLSTFDQTLHLIQQFNSIVQQLPTTPITAEV